MVNLDTNNGGKRAKEENKKQKTTGGSKLQNKKKEKIWTKLTQAMITRQKAAQKVLKK